MAQEIVELLSFGVSADTGLPIERQDSVVTGYAGFSEEEDKLKHVVGAPFPASLMSSYSLQFGFDPDLLSDAGWGLIFEAGTDATPYLDALAELIEWRRNQAGERFRVFYGADGYRPGESATAWLTRHGSSLNIINPDLGMPYYLIVVGPPSSIPFEFQYSLDIVAGVGRLDFPSFSEFQAYAHSVVSYEMDQALTSAREIELFATGHDFDRATQLFIKHVAQVLIGDVGKLGHLGKKQNFLLKPTLAEQATKARLASILSHPERAPSILFTGTHGMVFGSNDQRLMENQGALVCQDWPAYGQINAQHWFAAQDVPEDAKVHGLIHFFFACYGAGTPEFDNFRFDGAAARISPFSLTARLPQKLMTHPKGGALASLGHVDRAWASSFLSSNGSSQIQGFREVIDRLLEGQRLGLATDHFNNQWGWLSTSLTSALDQKNAGLVVNDADLLALRIARDDCRNYVVLGDPAVKLKPEPAHVQQLEMFTS